jgi:hypothetical protein
VCEYPFGCGTVSTTLVEVVVVEEMHNRETPRLKLAMLVDVVVVPE